MRVLGLLLCCLVVAVSCKNGGNEDKTPIKEGRETNTLFKSADSIVLSSGRLFKVDSFPSKFITPRPVNVWVPDGYSNENKYSVLYMHDGQMLFDSLSTWNEQEWKVDEWASKVMTEGKTEDFIVVAIHNIPDIRWQDLFPQKAFDFISEEDKLDLKSISGSKVVKLNGDNYLKFLVEELKPAIDSSYAVRTEQNHTYIMGSSMGGLMSMYAVSEYPDIFGGAACISTHWVGAMPIENNPYPEAIFNYMDKSFPMAGHHKMYFDYGNKTLDQYYPQYAPEVDRILADKGYSDIDSKNLFFEGTDHSENSWNQRLDVPLTFLLGQ
jgi:hypothetical protein